MYFQNNFQQNLLFTIYHHFGNYVLISAHLFPDNITPKQLLNFQTNKAFPYGEVLVFYLPIRFFYYLANLIIFTRSSRIPCIFFLEGGFNGIYLREKKFTLSYVVSEI